MSRRKFPIESKAKAVKAAIGSHHHAGWPKKIVCDYAVRDWKARRGNLAGRDHPRDRVSWEAWRSITEKRHIRKMQRVRKGMRQ